MNTEPTTPDGRYHVVHGRLWRAANPTLPAARRVQLARELLHGRRALKLAMASGDEVAEQRAKSELRRTRTRLGERGPVWWTDGAPDYHRVLVRNSPYAGWHAALEALQARDDDAIPVMPMPVPSRMPASMARAA
ncbi:MAG TPA: hypothetical protein VF457_15195 [Burkholderiaceae bacterium]